MHGNIHTRAQCNAIKKAGEVDQPFPIKPVSLNRLPRTQDRPGLQQFEKTTLSSQPRGCMMPLGYPSGGIRETPASFHSQKLSQKRQSEELQMTRAIQEKELLLQEKLWRLGEKIRQTIQSSSADTAAGKKPKNGNERQYSGQDEWEEVHTKGRLSEYQRTPLRRRDVLDVESLHEDLMQLRIKQGQSTEDRILDKQVLQQARWDHSEHTNSVHSNLKLEKLNEPFRRKGEVEKDIATRKETEARYRELNDATVGAWTREKKYKERTQRDNDALDNQQNMSQKGLQRLATENQKHTRENQPNESTLPLLAGSFRRSQQQQAGPSITNTNGGSFQLLPCQFCHRSFKSDALEKHVQICAKVYQKRRPVFNSSAQRCKGTQVEEYFKTHKRTKSPEVSH